MDVISENCARVGGQKWWRILVAHDIRKQKSYRLQPLVGARPDRRKETNSAARGKNLQNWKYLYNQIPIQETKTIVWKKPNFFFKDSVETKSSSKLGKEVKFSWKWPNWEQATQKVLGRVTLSYIQNEVRKADYYFSSEAEVRTNFSFS